MNKSLCVSTLLAGLLLSNSFAANIDWTGGNGTSLAWDEAANWSSDTVPANPNDTARFLNGANLSLLVPTGSSALSIVTHENTNVTLTLRAPSTPDTPTLTLGSFLDVGNNASPIGTAPSHVTVQGTGGILHASALRVGVTNNLDGHSLTFKDGVIVTSPLGNSGSIVGRNGFNNLLTVETGANVSVDNLSIGRDLGNGNNRLIITGGGSELTVGGTGSNRGLRVGTTTAGTSYANAMQNNYVQVSNGGRLIVAPQREGSTISVNIGGQTKAHDNYILVEGAGSAMELGKGVTTGSTQLRIGDANGENYGGNYLEVRNGGSLVSATGHNGSITIYGHDSSDPSAQSSNRLTVGEGGTVSVGGAIIVSGGLLQLASEGSLTAASITVGANGRFEAGGDDFQTTGSGTTIQNLGTLAIQEESLTLRSSVALAAGSTLEIHLLDDATAAGINFLLGGALSIHSTTKLSFVADDPLTLNEGSSWQIFTGDTLNGITGGFDLDLMALPTLSGNLRWDLSSFNQAGEWRVAVIPEPGSVILLSAGLALVAMRAFTRKSVSPKS